MPTYMQAIRPSTWDRIVNNTQCFLYLSVSEADVWPNNYQRTSRFYDYVRNIGLSGHRKGAQVKGIAALHLERDANSYWEERDSARSGQCVLSDTCKAAEV